MGSRRLPQDLTTKKVPETIGFRDFAVGLTGFEPATP